MRQCNAHLRIIEVPAGKSWDAALEHGVYSCPDMPKYERVVGATCLLLTNKRNGRRFFDVEAVELCDLRMSNFLDSVPGKFHHKLRAYTDAMQQVCGILDDKCDYRFYFLSDDPWPAWLQDYSERSSAEWAAILSLCSGPLGFFEWPLDGELLWPECTREDEKQVHYYPLELRQRLARLGLQPDTRNNGPAISAFLAAGGRRPICGSEGWPIHHIYDGTGGVSRGPQNVTHAANNGRHCTHSAGLVAAHPDAHHLAHQSDLLKWLLRREAFLRFGYDPMRAFSKP